MEELQSTDVNKGPNHRNRVVVLILGATILWALTPILLNQITHDTMVKGQIGDMFGVVNALFSGLAFGGAIYAVLLQISQLKEQREDSTILRRHNEDTIKQLTGQAKSLAAQVETVAAQQFLSIFNEANSNLNHALRSIEFKRIESHSSGTGGISVASIEWHGASAIKQQLQARHRSQQRKEVEVFFSMETIPQYLTMYLLALDCAEKIHSETARTYCVDMVKKAHQPILSDIVNNASNFAVDAGLISEVKAHI